MKNAYPNRELVTFDKVKSASIEHNCLCIGIQHSSTSVTNHHIEEKDFIKFITIHYMKEICDCLGISNKELEKFIVAKKV